MVNYHPVPIDIISLTCAPKPIPAMIWPPIAMFMLVARPVTRQPVQPSTPDTTTNHFLPHMSLACEVMGLSTAVDMDMAVFIHTCLEDPPTTAATFLANCKWVGR
jgi:hypothetical protein